VFHAIIKINLFFAAGSIMIYSKKEYVDEVAEYAKKLWKLMDINYDKFIRTTDDYHCKAVQKIVQKFVHTAGPV